MKYLVFPLALTAALVTGLTGPGGTVHAKPNGHVSIKITAEPKAAVSGYPVRLVMSLENQSGLPLRFVNSGGPWRFFACKWIGLNGRAIRVPNTRWGMGRGTVIETRASSPNPIRPIHHIAAGKARLWGQAFPLSRFYDLTMPGTYRFRVATQRPIYLVDGPIHAYLRRGGRLHAVTLGRSLYLPSLEESMRRFSARGIVRMGRAYSNVLRVRVRPPERRRQLNSALAAAGPVLPEGNSAGPKGAVLSVVLLPNHGHAFSVLARVTICAVKKSQTVRLTGNPFVDFRRVLVEGPDGYNGDELVKKPKPHYIPIPDHQQVPLTAYGKWLLKHPPKKLPAKLYTLKPGVVYKYAVPINLSCQYDMSLAGTYRVRVELAHPKIWSNWIKVKVPQ